MKCTTSCNPSTADSCPSGLECLAAGSSTTVGDCWPSDSGGGCCDASGKSASGSLMLFGLVALVLRRRSPRS